MTALSWRARRAIMAIATAVLVIGAMSLPAIPDPTSHSYADQRTWFGVPNFLDVLSNLPFALVGILGLIATFRRGDRRSPFVDPWERWPYAVLFSGVLLVAFGSAYYHLSPDIHRLVWDRLPITFGFTGLLTAVIAERVSVRAARWLLAPLLVLAVISVLLWYWTELQGASDLRLYILVQGGSALVAALLVLLYRARYSGAGYFAAALVLYGLGKAFEAADENVFALGRVVSGHTLKHFIAAAAVGCLVAMLRVRQQAGAAEQHEFPGSRRAITAG